MTGKISEDPDKVVNGSEKVAAASGGSNFGIFISSIASYLASLVQTLTNKTIDATSNTVSNLALSMFAANVVDTDGTLAANSDTRVATQKAVKTYTDAHGASGSAGGYLSGTYPNPNVAKVQGVTNGSNASAGDVGEIISSTVPIGSAVSLTTAVAANITSISLTAGDWDVTGNVQFSENGAAAAATTGQIAGVTTTTGSIPSPPGVSSVPIPASGGIAFVENTSLSIGPVRISVTSTTTVYLTARCTFSAGTCAGYGYIQGRRVR